jgi:DNA-binding transcriptional LysR family regulator
MNQDYNDMAIFAVVAEQNSFTKAAKKLGMPKSSVSRHMSQLEERLGERLLNRTTRRITLTEVGKMYVEHCRRIVEEAESAHSSLASLQAQPAGRLRVTAPLAFGGPLLQSLINDFLAAHPKIDMDLILDNRVVDLVDEEVDIAIRVGPLPPSSLIARSMGSSVLCLCATPEFIEENGAPKTIDELLNYNVIQHPNVPISLEDGTLVSTNSRFQVNDMGLIASIALQGFGIGLAPLPLVFEHIKEGSLVPLLLDYPLRRPEFFLVYPSRRQLASKTLAFINYAMESVPAMGHWNVSLKDYLEKEQIKLTSR